MVRRYDLIKFSTSTFPAVLIPRNMYTPSGRVDFSTIPFEIIFVTGFNDYALDALKVSAIDYLLKPVKTPDLVAAVQKASEGLEERHKIEQYEVLKHNLQYLGEQASRLAIPSAQAYDFVQVAQIIRCEGWQKYTKIYLQEGSCIVSSYSIGVFRQPLIPHDFYQVHKSHLINTKLIQRYLTSGTVVMTDDAAVPVARRKLGAVLKALFQ